MSGKRPAPVFRPKPNAIETIFGRRKAMIGMIRLRALPGAPEYQGESVQSLVDADVAIVTGQRTGNAATTEELPAIASGTALPVVVGSGVTLENAGAILRLADGVIVATTLKPDGVWWNPVDSDCLRHFMACVAMARG
jgi:predicted TIM-barrel enzyme